MGYTLREAKYDDLALVLDLTKSAMLSYSADSGIDSSILESMHERVDDLALKLKTHTCLCFFDKDNRPVGTITLIVRTDLKHFVFSDKTREFLKPYDRALYITRFAVSDELRGTGFGKELLDQAFLFAQDKGASIAILHTAIANTNRVEFYKNRGFELVDSESSRGYERGLFAYTINDLKLD